MMGGPVSAVVAGVMTAAATSFSSNILSSMGADTGLVSLPTLLAQVCSVATVANFAL
jgi:hypothetical protein